MKNSGLAGPRRSALRATAKNLRTYLNDHLAASVTAIKLLSRLQSLNGQEDLPRFAGEMRLEIEQDQGELKKLMQRLRITKSRTRMATAWFAHQLTDLKMRFDDPRDHRLRRLEMLELVEVGLEGKRALWQALSAALAHSIPNCYPAATWNGASALGEAALSWCIAKRRWCIIPRGMTGNR